MVKSSASEKAVWEHAPVEQVHEKEPKALFAPSVDLPRRPANLGGCIAR